MDCLRRLMTRKLSSKDSNSDDIRNIITSSLTSNDPKVSTNIKRLASLEQPEVSLEESKDTYDDAIDEDEGPQQLEDTKANQDVEVDSDLNEAKGITKREAKNDYDYDEDRDENFADSSASASESDDVKKIEKPREVSAEVDPEVDFVKQIEDQIQLKIDSIKEDIKRDIERKQRVRAIETNNAKYDELLYSPEDDEVEGRGSEDSNASKRSISSDPGATNEAEKTNLDLSVRSKRSDLGEVKEPDATNEAEPTSLDSSARSKRSDLDEVKETDATNEAAQPDLNLSVRPKRSGISEVKKTDTRNEAGQASDNLSVRSQRSDLGEVKEAPRNFPVKKRSQERQVILVKRNDSRNLRKRKNRSSLLIPERGHAEVKDELPSDLTLDPKLRFARTYERTKSSDGNLRSARSVGRSEEISEDRYKRDMSEELEDDKGASVDESNEELPGNFLFERGERSDGRARRRRSRPEQIGSKEKRKTRKHPRRSRRHRSTRVI